MMFLYIYRYQCSNAHYDPEAMWHLSMNENEHNNFPR